MVLQNTVKGLFNVVFVAHSWCTLRLRTETKKMGYNEIGLCAQNKDTVVGSILNTNWRLMFCHSKIFSIFTY